MLFIQVQQFRTTTRYGLEILHQCRKRVKTKSQKVLGANFYVSRSYKDNLVGGLFKVMNRMSTGLTEHIFEFLNKTYELRSNSILLGKRNKAVFYRTESLSSFFPKIWELIPQPLKDETELLQFKTKIKT